MVYIILAAVYKFRIIMYIELGVVRYIKDYFLRLALWGPEVSKCVAIGIV